jgi:hypothetical protein
MKTILASTLLIAMFAGTIYLGIIYLTPADKSAIF